MKHKIEKLIIKGSQKPSPVLAVGLIVTHIILMEIVKKMSKADQD